uniref:Lipocalin/cytosolic fatty-acid binding domain-containing protein n=1 Tax=Peromyscus maniculatus bairdii TaxID=230844 RepID=A0A8C8UFM3_PERMB
TMVKFLLLALAFGLAHAHAEVDGKWETVAIAADNVDKIEVERPLRLYLRELTCNEECSEMGVTFYVKESVFFKYFHFTDEGDNKYELVYLTEEHAVFTSKNVDRAGTETNLIFVLGKGGALNEEEHEKLVKFAEDKNIPTENIRNVLATGNINENFLAISYMCVCVLMYINKYMYAYI